MTMFRSLIRSLLGPRLETAPWRMSAPRGPEAPGAEPFAKDAPSCNGYGSSSFFFLWLVSRDALTTLHAINKG